MTSSSTSESGIHRGRLFAGICLALIPTGASFGIVSNILVQLKEEFILTNYQVGLIGGAALWGMAISLLVLGPLLEAFGLKNGTRMAFAAHVAGITLMISAVTQVGDPSAFWLLMAGAATLAVGNGMIEVAGNPLVAALYPAEKTTRLNLFHAFFPIGIILGGIVGFVLVTYAGGLGRWPFQLGAIYVPIMVYGWTLLPERFPKTENAEAGLPVAEMFRYTLTHPLFLLMLLMMAITTSMELGPMRWVPAMLEAVGMHGILVLVWISGWMVVLRLLATHFVERLAPTGMLLGAAVLTGSGLFLLSFVQGMWSALVAATIFAWGVAFFFPTMVGFVSERLPKTGSLGIVLTAGVGLGTAGAVGVPAMGKVADRYLAEALDPVATVALLESVDETFPGYLERARDQADAAVLGYRARDVQEAYDANRAALAAYRESGQIAGDATANALRAIVGTALAEEPLVAEASALLMPAEALGGQTSFRFVAPFALILILVFGTLHLRDRRAGGYRAIRLEDARKPAAMAMLLLLAGGCAPPDAGVARAERGDRLKVLFLGDDGHHRPGARARQVLPVLAENGIDLFYTDLPDDLNPGNLSRFDALVLYNNHVSVSPPQLAALLEFVDSGHGLVVLHCASASFQNSEEFISLVGAAFKSHGTGTFGAVRVAPGHPAIEGVPTFESWDETYVHAKHNTVNRTVLEVRREAGHDEPWTWVRTYGQGRVYYTAWGHDARTWGTDGFQQMLGRGIRWASGDWALELRPDDPVLETMTLEVPLPTYERPPAEWNTLSDPVYEAQVALPTEESLELMSLPPGFRVEPFAFEPMIGNVIDFTWDERGRMWAVETQDYPNNLLPDGEPGNDRILIIEDTDRDGRADRTTVFAEGLNLATSLAFAGGGLVVAQAPHIFFFEDTDGDDRADVKRTIMSGWPRDDTHGTPSNFRYGLDNQVLASVGYNGFRGTVGGVTYGRGDIGAGYFRFEPDGSSLDYLARTSNNTWGVDQSEDGYVFGSTANRRPSGYVHIPGRYYRSIERREPVLPGIEDSPAIYPVTDILQVDQFDMYTAGSAHELYTARAFPSEYWNRVAFVAEPTGHLIGMFDVRSRGSTFEAKNRWSFAASRDQWAAPVQVKVGPDGALWVSDFYTLVAQHNPTPRYDESCCERGPGNAYETPNRDRLHGRIYRISHEDAPPASTTLEDARPHELVEALQDDNMFWRLTAQRLLVERAERDVVPALIELASSQSVDGLGLDVGALHALWTLDGLGAIEEGSEALTVVRAALRHPAAGVRRAAIQLLPRDGRLLEDVLGAGILPDRASPTPVDYTVPSGTLQDADPKVRLEALLAVSELAPSPRAAEVIGEVLRTPANARDPWLPDAAGIAGAHQGVDFLLEVLGGELPSDSASARGIGRAARMMARYHASAASAETALVLVEAATSPPALVGAATLEGIATGWPEGSPPDLSGAQRARLSAAARRAPELQEAFQLLAERWGVSRIGAP